MNGSVRLKYPLWLNNIDITLKPCGVVLLLYLVAKPPLYILYIFNSAYTSLPGTGLYTSVVVFPGIMTFSLNPSKIMAQAVSINFLYHPNWAFGIVPMNSTDSMGTDTSLSVQRDPSSDIMLRSSPTCNPELNAI
jgi:hypothetical protein